MATVLNYFTKITPAKQEEKFLCDRYRKLAPKYNEQHVNKFNINHKDNFDSTILSQNSSQSYLEQIRNKTHEPFRLRRKTKGPLRARLLQFHVDVRPPYWGTWQKRSNKVTGRRPFHQDNELFDYEVDSEAEWDVGGPGESLHGSSDEGEGEQEDYEIDMSFFVPHGYVSDDEVHQDSDQEGDNDLKQQTEMEADDETPASEEKKTPRLDLKPLLIGPHFNDAPLSNQKHVKLLTSFQALYKVNTPAPDRS